MVSGGVVSESKQNTYGNLIDEFFTYCINKEPEKAYDLLSSDCKKVLYPSEKIFETLYYNEKFNGNKMVVVAFFSSINVFSCIFLFIYNIFIFVIIPFF